MSALLAACSAGDAPDLIGATPRGFGPVVTFDVSARPLPLIPLPNDVATFPDPTSRTGRRLNATLAGASTIERRAREAFSELEGWGTTAPLTVQFDRPAGLAEDLPAIDLEAFAARHAGYDLRDDAVYVVDLTTGVPALLEVAHGHFPPTLASPGMFWPNDPRASEQNLLFETVDEAPGRPRSAYDPFLDTDFDGVLDKPNDGLGARGVRGVDDILPFYERESDTLLLRPILPFAEKREYAVVLTDRLVDDLGQPVRSPFPQVYHALQRLPIERLGRILGDGRLNRFYGDLAGTGLTHVAFAWSFTTGPQAEDLRILRDGLAGKGSFSWLARDYPPSHELFRAVGKYAAGDGPAGWQELAECKGLAPRLSTIRFADFMGPARTVVDKVFGFKGPELEAVLASLANVEHFVVGTFVSPQLVGDPVRVDPGSHFRVNFLDGTAQAVPQRVKFWIAIPRETARAKQPFPLAVWNHGTGLFAEELLFHAGAMAQQGIALASIDMPGHGLPLDATTSSLARALLGGSCLAPLVKALETTRARDLNADGEADPGRDLWSSDAFHTRDLVRQSVVDELQFFRVLRTFDGRTRAGTSYVQGAGTTLAGDFDGNGVIDFAGATAPHAIVGESFGGLVSQVVGALAPEVKVVAPIAAAAGLGDVAARSFGVVDAVLGKLLSPLLVAVPATERGAGASAPSSVRTGCTAGQRSLRFIVNDLDKAAEIEVGCLGDDRAPARASFVLTNLANGAVRCGRSDATGRVRIPVPASLGDPLVLTTYAEAGAVASFKTCALASPATRLATLNTWEVATLTPHDVPSNPAGCPSGATGCQQFQASFYAVGSPLVAPQEGYGLRRQTPEFRRLMNLTQHAVDAADPANYAQAYVIAPLADPAGRPMPPRALLNIGTLGDGYVNIGASVQFARVAGLIPFVPGSDAARQPEYLPWAVPSSLKMLWGKTPDELLVDRGVVEGLSRLGRFPAGPTCGVNFTPSAGCGAGPVADAETCANTLYDPDFLDEGAANYGQQHPSLPLRLAREASAPMLSDADLVRAYRPRSQSKPLYTDAEGSGGGVPLAAHLGALVSPTGQHAWFAANPCKSFDDVRYLENLLARFIATAGTDLPYLSRPGSHGCLARGTCDFLAP